MTTIAINLNKTCRKLISALNSKGYKVTFAAKQFVGREGYTRNYFTISNAVWDEDKNRYQNVEIYSSGAMVNIIFFLRDMWFEVNNWEVPKPEARWAKEKAKLLAKGD